MMVKNGQTFETFIKYQQKMRGKDAKGNKLFQAQSVKELNDDDDDDASIERDEKDKVLKNKLLVSLAVFWICDERASRRKAQEQDTMQASFAAGIRQAPREQSGSRSWHQRYEPKP